MDILYKTLKDSFEDQGICIEKEDLNYLYYKTFESVSQLLRNKDKNAVLLVANSKSSRFFQIVLEINKDNLELQSAELQQDEFLDILSEAQKEGHNIKPNI